MSDIHYVWVSVCREATKPGKQTKLRTLEDFKPLVPKVTTNIKHS